MNLKRWGKIGLPLLFTIILLSFFFSKSFFSVRKIEIISSLQNIKGLELFNNKNLVFLDGIKITDQLLKINPRYESIQLIKKYPSTLLLITQDPKPLAFLINKNDRLLLGENKIITVNEFIPDGLPKIEIPNLVLVDYQHLDWRILRALKMIKYLDEYGFKVKNIIINSGDLMFKLYLSDNTEIVVPENLDISKLAASLQIIITRFRIEGKFISQINFNFDKPIIVLNNGEKITSL